jgi:hypothetical protein
MTIITWNDEGETAESHFFMWCERMPLESIVPEVLTYMREERGASATGGRGSHVHKETVTTLRIVRYITRG